MRKSRSTRLARKFAAPAEKLNVSLDLADLSYLRPGDKVELSGWHITGDKGRAWATRVTATAAASLSEASSKKGKAK